MTMAALPPEVADLAAWTGQDITSNDPRAEAVLSAATALVRGYASKAWDDDSVPEEVHAVVVQVAARVWINPSGAVQWTKGPFSERYTNDAANGLYLTDEEKSVLNKYRTTASGLSTLTTTRESATTGTIYVPTGPAPSGYPFPWHAADGY